MLKKKMENTLKMLPKKLLKLIKKNKPTPLCKDYKLPKIEVNLFIYDTLIFGNIPFQNDCFLGCILDDSIPTTLAMNYDGYHISIFKGPFMTEKGLYLRGKNSNYNNDLFFYNFETREEAVEWFNNIERLLFNLDRFSIVTMNNTIRSSI